jgi:hypothetical protein
MSDRQKGLLKAVSTVFPNSSQRFCLRHIYANFQTAGFKGEDLKKCMDNAAYAYTKDGFDKAMEEMKKQCELAWTWLTKILVLLWMYVCVCVFAVILGRTSCARTRLDQLMYVSYVCVSLILLIDICSLYLLYLQPNGLDD